MNSIPVKSCSKLLFKFGIIADVQYVDAPDALNFNQVKLRKYRQSKSIYAQAIESWSALCNATHSSQNFDGIRFALVLGDVIDGKSAENKSQLTCFQQLKELSKNLPFNLLYCFGNHCHYSFDRASLVKHFLSDKPWLMKPMHSFSSSQCTPSRIYYHWSPYPGWRFISVDSYDVSLIGSSSTENKKLAEELLAQNNPNDLKISSTWFKNLPYNKRRWVPYNGGVSEAQLDWLRTTLQESKQRGEQ
eukprot:gene32097-42839_t